MLITGEQIDDFIDAEYRFLEYLITIYNSSIK